MALKEFVRPEIKVVEIDSTDIIAQSGTGGTGKDAGWDPDEN